MTRLCYHLATLLALFAVLMTGCAARDIERAYGQRRGAGTGSSVNGTAVLSQMFKNAGHRVRTWRRMSPRLQDAQTIVWFPNDFQPPTAEQREFVEDWLSSGSDRTFVYVGRDFDAAMGYWKKMLVGAPPEELMEISRRMATAQAEYDAVRARMPAEEAADWFTIARDEPRRVVDSLEGPWSDGIDATKAEIEVSGRLAIPDAAGQDEWVNRLYYYYDETPTYTPLLKSDDDVLVTQIAAPGWSNSKLLVVTNGSFLLNLPLVNHEHRKLADRLLAACSDGDVIFLESGWGGPGVFDEEPGTNYPTGFEAFTVWPIGFIVMHLTILGILCCFAVFPIFGRPREVVVAEQPQKVVTASQVRLGSKRSDFGSHITALGELLELTEDRRYAWQRLQYYHDHVKSDTGSRHW